MTKMITDLGHRYPRLTPSAQGLAIRLRGLQGPEQDPALARDLRRVSDDEALWRHASWWLPAQPTSISALADMGVAIPAETSARVAFLDRASAAREHANAWRLRPVAWQRQWLAHKGLRFRDSQPLDHQVTSIGWALQAPLAALFLDTGTGKTFIAATVLQALRDLRGPGPALVIAPKSVLREGWGADIARFTWLTWMDIGDPPAPPALTTCPVCHRDFAPKVPPKAHLKTHMARALASDSAGAWARLYARHPGLVAPGSVTREARVTAALARTDIDVYVINPEQAKINRDALKARGFRVLVVDESSMLRAHDSQTTEAVIDLALTIPRRIAMSGTPRPNSSLELWGQMAMLDACLGHDFRVYRDRYFQVDFTGYKWLPRPGANNAISQMVHDRSLRYRLEDCVDLPGEVTETREVELTDELRRQYRAMLDDMIVELEDDKIATAHKFVQLNKLSQITSGFIYDQDKVAHYLDHGNPRLQETVALAKKLVEEEGRSVVIWIKWSAVEGPALAAALSKLGVSQLLGGMSSDQISKSIQDFKSGNNRVMVAHPLSAKYGHTWTHATVAIFHSYGYSWEDYYQAKRRIYRIGQKQPVTYVNIVARKTVDKAIMAALMRKQDESAAVIDRQFLDELRGTL